MKVCIYCGNDVTDSAERCPYCASTKFRYRCPKCGAEHEGMYCPECQEREEAQVKASMEARVIADEVSRANQGLAWKTALTVFLPFVGGYFLVREHVRTGFRVFAIAWCSIISLTCAMGEGTSIGAKVIATLLCMGPIIVYVYKNWNKLLHGEGVKGKACIVGMALVLAVSLLGDVFIA